MPASLSVFSKNPAAKWITLVGGALTMGVMTAFLVKRHCGRKAKAEGEEDRPKTEADLDHEMEFLMSRLFLSDDDELKARMLVTLANDFAMRPTFQYLTDDTFTDLLRKLILAPSSKIRKNALYACCNFARLPNIHECKSLLNTLFGKLRFLRYAQSFDELTDVLTCLVNVAYNDKTHKFFLPSLEILGEIISHQRPGRIGPARLAAWKILINLVSNQEMVLTFSKLQWQWLVAINCDNDCELRRVTFFSNILDYFIENPTEFTNMAKGELIVALTSPMTNQQLKERFELPNVPVPLDYACRLLQIKLNRVYDMMYGEARTNAAFQNETAARDELKLFTFNQFCGTRCTESRLFPDPEHGAFGGRNHNFPYHLLEQWDERTIRDAAIRAVNWYNRMASMCRFPPAENRLPIAVRFIEQTEEQDFIGDYSRDWTINLSNNVAHSLKTYEETGTEESASKAADVPLPESLLGQELVGKDEYGHAEYEAARSSMNLILDELALLCVPMYRDVMQFREIPGKTVPNMPYLFKHDTEFRGFANKAVNHIIPEPEHIKPYRPFIREDNDEEESTEILITEKLNESTTVHPDSSGEDVDEDETVEDIGEPDEAKEKTIGTYGSLRVKSWMEPTKKIVAEALEAALNKIDLEASDYSKADSDRTLKGSPETSDPSESTDASK